MLDDHKIFFEIKESPAESPIELILLTPILLTRQTVNSIGYPNECALKVYRISNLSLSADWRMRSRAGGAVIVIGTAIR